MSNELNIRVKQFFEKNNLTLIKSFPVLWDGWECDNEWYLCKDQTGKKVFVVTNNCIPHIGQAFELEDKIDYYREVLETTEEILKELEESK